MRKATGLGEFLHDGATAEENNASQVPIGEHEHTDRLLASYFRAIRRHPLLGFEEERRLWSCITAAAKRERRVLCMAPVAMSVLLRIHDEFKQPNAKLEFVLLRSEDELTAHVDDLHRQFTDAVQELEEILRKLRGCGRADRTMYIALGRQWCKTFESLELHPRVYAAIQTALAAEYEAQPENRALYVAHCAGQGAHNRLIALKGYMVQANLRLVVFMANRYRGSEIPFLDLIQDGNIGLMRPL